MAVRTSTFDDIGKFEAWLRAADIEFARGSKCSVDPTDGWDHWPYVALPIEQVGSPLNIEPRAT